MTMSITYFCQLCQFPEIHEKLFPSFFWISCDKIIVQAPSIPHFKGLGMRSLQYKIIIYQKIDNKITMTMSSYVLTLIFTESHVTISTKAKHSYCVQKFKKTVIQNSSFFFFHWWSYCNHQLVCIRQAYVKF